MTRPRFTDARFRTQTTLLLGTLVLALAGILCAVSGALIARTTHSQVGNALGVVATNAQRVLSRGLRQRLRIVQAIAGTSGLWDHGLDSPEVLAAIDLEQRSGQQVAWIGVADARGIVRAATGDLLVGRDVSARPWFAAGKAGVHVGDVHEALMLAALLPRNQNGEPQRFVDFAVPIVVGGEVRGVIGCTADGTGRGASSRRFCPAPLRTSTSRSSS